MKHEDIAFVDIETTMRGPEGSSSPFYHENAIVALGIRNKGFSHMTHAVDGYPLTVPQKHRLYRAKLMVGHNFSFDLHYLWKYEAGLQEHMGRRTRIWDTQLAQFTLEAMTHPFPSLEYSTGHNKLNAVKDLWAAGVDTMDIPKDLLLQYLAGDLSDTEYLYYTQVREATAKGLMPLLWHRMEALQATIDMTYNGMRIDVSVLAEAGRDMESRLAVDKMTMLELVAPLGIQDFSPTSNKDVALALHGGQQVQEYQEEIGVYKTGARKGEAKYRKAERVAVVQGFGLPVDSRTKGGDPAVGANALKRILAETPKGSDGARFLDALLRVRADSKQLNTYVNGLPTHVKPDGLIHHGINHAVTRTGRLSSSDPNLQNVTNGPIKAAFVPLATFDYLVEHDFSQLEMIALAILANDAVLLSDIISGMDTHSYFYEMIYVQKPTKEQRTRFKRLTFGLVYGAGAGTLSINSGLPKKVCETFIKYFYDRYVGVAKYHTWILDAAAKGGTYAEDLRSPKGDPIRTYLHKSVTGREYHFQEYERPWGKPGFYNFSPTQLKNRPVQGWATADIVPIALGLLYRAVYSGIIKGCRVKLMNTVHDSVLACVSGDVEEYIVVAKRVLESVKQTYERTWNTTLPIDLPVGASFGPNWLDMKEYGDDSRADLTLTKEEREELWESLSEEQ